MTFWKPPFFFLLDLVADSCPANTGTSSLTTPRAPVEGIRFFCSPTPMYEDTFF